MAFERWIGRRRRGSLPLATFYNKSLIRLNVYAVKEFKLADVERVAVFVDADKKLVAFKPANNEDDIGLRRLTPSGKGRFLSLGGLFNRLGVTLHRGEAYHLNRMPDGLILINFHDPETNRRVK